MSSSKNKESLDSFISKLAEWFTTTFKEYLIEAKTKEVLNNIEEEVQTQIEEEVKEHFEPLFSEEAPKNLSSPAGLLGGAMRLTAKWQKKQK
tara:strand:- start:447 stop:722 length:276 start_codon:yes stop_codon:yes gene_type:complete